MNTRLFLSTAAGAMLWLPAAHAGSRSGGTGTATFTIPADTVSTGGGSSTGGSGANAVTVTASMGGIIGTVIAASPAVTNRQGYIPQTTGLSGFDLWASQNIPAGRDATFTGDWNGDGIPNGAAYVFGNTRVSPTGKGRIPVPPSIPGDVEVYLDWSDALGVWESIASWTSGLPPVFSAGDVSIIGSEVVDTFSPEDGSAFYRYRVVRR